MDEKDTVSVLLNSTMMDAQKHKLCVLGMMMTCVNTNLDYCNRAHWEDFLNQEIFKLGLQDTQAFVGADCLHMVNGFKEKR